jgi:hypothetical protein
MKDPMKSNSEHWMHLLRCARAELALNISAPIHHCDAGIGGTADADLRRRELSEEDSP